MPLSLADSVHLRASCYECRQRSRLNTPWVRASRLSVLRASEPEAAHPTPRSLSAADKRCAESARIRYVRPQASAEPLSRPACWRPPRPPSSACPTKRPARPLFVSQGEVHRPSARHRGALGAQVCACVWRHGGCVRRCRVVVSGSCQRGRLTLALTPLLRPARSDVPDIDKKSACAPPGAVARNACLAGGCSWLC